MPQRVHHARRQDTQQFFTDGAPELVVGGRRAFEIEEQHCEVTLSRRMKRQRACRMGLETAAIGQASERVAVRRRPGARLAGPRGRQRFAQPRQLGAQ